MKFLNGLIIFLIIIIVLCIFRKTKEDFRINMKIRNSDDIINKNKKMNNNLFINKSAKGYRLADIYKDREFRNDKQIIKNYQDNFSNSIAFKYMKSIKKKKIKDFDLLIKLIDEHRIQNIINIPRKDQLVVHLRTGDVIDDTNESSNSFLTNNVIFDNKVFNNHIYVKPLQYYKNILPDLRNYDIHDIVFVTGFHTNMNGLQNNDKSIKYVSSIMEFFKNRGFEVSLRMNRDPDDDLVFMSNSSYFLGGGGGFSDLIKKIVSHKGGNLIISDSESVPEQVTKYNSGNFKNNINSFDMSIKKIIPKGLGKKKIDKQLEKIKHDISKNPGLGEVLAENPNNEVLGAIPNNVDEPILSPALDSNIIMEEKLQELKKKHELDLKQKLDHADKKFNEKLNKLTHEKNNEISNLKKKYISLNTISPQTKYSKSRSLPILNDFSFAANENYKLNPYINIPNTYMPNNQKITFSVSKNNDGKYSIEF